MNERIKELMAQAVRFRLDPDSNAYEAQVSPEDLELFAELIVRECSDIAYQSLYEDRVFDDSPHNIRCNVMDAIKKHFGVEE